MGNLPNRGTAALVLCLVPLEVRGLPRYNTRTRMSPTPSPQLALFGESFGTESPSLPEPPRRQGRQSSARTPCLLRLCVLGSGSGGNSTVLSVGDDAILIDCGFGPHTTARRLTQCGRSLDCVKAVCVTHLDQDHFRRSWPAALLRRGIKLYIHHWHLPDLHSFRGAAALFEAGLVETFDEGEAFFPLVGLKASVVRLQHDMQGTVGYRFEATDPCSGFHHGTVGYATDLGHVPAALVEHFAGVDVLCLECNYDERMTVDSPRPTFVNRRNMSDSGHLSNEQAFEAVRRICERSPGGGPRHVLLMHRSQLCNHPTKVKRVFERDGQLKRRIVLTEQRRRTRWFDIRPLPAVRREQGVLVF